MKKISLTILFLSGFIFTASAQLPNLNKLKDKAKTTLNNTAKNKKEEVLIQEVQLPIVLPQAVAQQNPAAMPMVVRSMTQRVQSTEHIALRAMRFHLLKVL